MRLKERTPYMVRNDGEIFECRSIHPYILHDVKESFATNMVDLFNDPWFLNWFLDHSNQNIKPLMKECLECLAGGVLGMDDSFEATHKFGMDKDILKIFLNELSIVVDPKPANDIDDNYIATCKALWEELNNRMNQEFLRVRMSDKYRGGSGKDIYARVSSFDFNWFDIIWNLVYENRTQLSSITISADHQAGKKINTPDMIYIIDGQPIDHMDIEEFINLNGRPLIESNEHPYMKNLEGGLPLNEAIPDFGSFHNNRNYEAHREIYIKTHFVESKRSNKRTFVK